MNWSFALQLESFLTGLGLKVPLINFNSHLSPMKKIREEIPLILKKASETAILSGEIPLIYPISKAISQLSRNNSAYFRLFMSFTGKAPA
ncbi:hypothetical protein [Bacillus sp. P14.5]|uniref:hypothetical protein n=1 Tax=Bacillus sp. P14.5 TaxID=1983400 RepID=UPI000DE9F60E|nr:hypothetical protein [Bacillus sp. P14.5]